MFDFLWSLLSISTILTSLFCGVVLPAWAQTTSMGTITGLVTDQSNAIVPDAAVTIKDTATNEERTANTNSAGRYVFVNLPPGTYDITVTKPGFQKVSNSQRRCPGGNGVDRKCRAEGRFRNPDR